MKKTIIVHNINFRKPVSEQAAFKESGLGESVSEASISRVFEKITEVHRIDEVPWKDYPYLPEVTFKIARTEKGLYLQYNVREEYIRAVYSETNNPVYEDSCVEFFLSAGKIGYYNFEFNCIGTALIGFGTSRQDRKWIAPKNIEQIKRFSSLGRKPFKEKKGPYRWNLSIYIPFLFFKESLKESSELRAPVTLKELGGIHASGAWPKDDLPWQDHKPTGKLYNFPRAKVKSLRANFYKCGDKLSIPHYVAWNRIKTEMPDFHRPEYFGKLVFTE